MYLAKQRCPAAYVSRMLPGITCIQGVVRHVGEVSIGIGRALHRAAIRGWIRGEDLVVLPGAADPDGVWMTGGRGNPHIVGALRHTEYVCESSQRLFFYQRPQKFLGVSG